jgi:hypothetical protein
MSFAENKAKLEQAYSLRLSSTSDFVSPASFRCMLAFYEKGGFLLRKYEYCIKHYKAFLKERARYKQVQNHYYLYCHMNSESLTEIRKRVMWLREHMKQRGALPVIIDNLSNDAAEWYTKYFDC